MKEVFIDCTYFEPHKRCLVFIFCTCYRFSCFPIALDASIGGCDRNSFYNFHWQKYHPRLSYQIIKNISSKLPDYHQNSQKICKHQHAEFLTFHVQIVGKFLCSVIAMAWVCFRAFLYYWRLFSVLNFTFQMWSLLS